MTLHKLVNGVKVDLTPAEEAATLAEWAKNEIEAAKVAYIHKRQSEYPSVQEQFDLLWHDIQDGVVLSKGEWYTAIETIKDKYPKPE